MTLERMTEGYKILDKIMDVDQIEEVANRFIKLYDSKYQPYLMLLARNTEDISVWYEDRDYAFKRYCSLNYGERE